VQTVSEGRRLGDVFGEIVGCQCSTGRRRAGFSSLPRNSRRRPASEHTVSELSGLAILEPKKQGPHERLVVGNCHVRAVWRKRSFESKGHFAGLLSFGR
jgi:hypothetical protein